MAGIIALLSTVALLASVVGIFMKRHRRKARWALPISLIVLLGALGTIGNNEARQLGFIDATDKTRAEEAGFTSADAWAAERERLAAERAEEERIAAEDRAEAERIAADRKAEADRLAAIEREEERARAQAEREQRQREQEAREREEEAACASDIQCWGDKHHLRASFACEQPVSRLARLNYRWVDGWMEGKFSHFRWRDRDEGVVTFIGDRIEFQNGFGAWIRHTYECDYDPKREVVLDVRGRQGFLD